VHDKPRTLREIYDAEKEYFDKIWYARSLIYDERVERKDAEPLDPEIAGQEDAAMKRVMSAWRQTLPSAARAVIRSCAHQHSGTQTGAPCPPSRAALSAAVYTHRAHHCPNGDHHFGQMVPAVAVAKSVRLTMSLSSERGPESSAAVRR
jgi:hypothetical protein